MKKQIMTIIFMTAVMLFLFSIAASANSLAPDRSQQVLDLLAVECQNISDYYYMAQYGDTSRYGSVKNHIAVTINNISLLMNGYDNDSVNALWNMYNQFDPDLNSAGIAKDTCAAIRGNIYYKISNDKTINGAKKDLSDFDDCASAGYHVSGGTCFIGGTPVYDPDGNLIGYYYSDCFDNAGFHMGSCWDCFYGADNEGCIEKR